MEKEPFRANTPEKLPHKIKVFRTMSSTEFHKFINGEQITPAVEKDEGTLKGVSTADTSAIWFSPDRLEYFSEPASGDSLVSEDLPELDFANVRETWNLGRGGLFDPITNNLTVEFLTDKKPDVVYGKYDEVWVKEYTYPEYDRDDFRIQRIYKIADRKVIFDRASLPEDISAEEILSSIANTELAEEQEMERSAAYATRILKEHIKDLPSPD